MKSLNDLNELLFRQLEKLEQCEIENLDAEIAKSKAIKDVASTIIDNARTALEAVKLSDAKCGVGEEMPPMLDFKKGDK